MAVMVGVPVLISSSSNRSTVVFGFQLCGRDTTHTVLGTPSSSS
jgi:hypothetical protein